MLYTSGDVGSMSITRALSTFGEGRGHDCCSLRSWTVHTLLHHEELALHKGMFSCVQTLQQYVLLHAARCQYCLRYCRLRMRYCRRWRYPAAFASFHESSAQ